MTRNAEIIIPTVFSQFKLHFKYHSIELTYFSQEEAEHYMKAALAMQYQIEEVKTTSKKS